ncbi:hypothetical protein PACTADRAFT_4943 [Pachysolen tannophilus NRRL Y-2460]|uniref:Uncharacterized protein n=1 Tax=Pachysolen tannophilus NRRL Y-2460 TaxID=669874 RepID=A0A1E4TN19_PACTA|nr:hypothetical protein PACTADRAFT_4943 [Pachysolen tannophilus NRRL Y-2460]
MPANFFKKKKNHSNSQRPSGNSAIPGKRDTSDSSSLISGSITSKSSFHQLPRASLQQDVYSYTRNGSSEYQHQNPNQSQSQIQSQSQSQSAQQLQQLQLQQQQQASQHQYHTPLLAGQQQHYFPNSQSVSPPEYATPPTTVNSNYSPSYKTRQYNSANIPMQSTFAQQHQYRTQPTSYSATPSPYNRNLEYSNGRNYQQAQGLALYHL